MTAHVVPSKPVLLDVGPLGLVRKAYQKSPKATISGLVLALIALVAIAAPILAPHDPNKQELVNRFSGLTRDHLLGTDDFGRDVLSRLIYAGRPSLFAPPLAVGIAIFLGVPTGLVAGFFGGIVDTVLSRVADALLSIPAIISAIAIVAILGPNLTNAMLAIGIAYGPRLYRVTRGAVLGIKQEPYIESSHSIDARPIRIMAVHVLPNILGPVLVQITLLLGFALLAESSLSFLGLGVQVPQASWGAMLRSAYHNSYESPWSVLPPGVMITITIFSINALGDGIRDVLAKGNDR